MVFLDIASVPFFITDHVAVGFGAGAEVTARENGTEGIVPSHDLAAKTLARAAFDAARAWLCRCRSRAAFSFVGGRARIVSPGGTSGIRGTNREYRSGGCRGLNGTGDPRFG